MSANEPAPLRLSPGELTAFFGDMAALFKEKETEQDWDERDRMLQKLRGVARVPGIGRDPTFLEGLRTAADTLCKTVGRVGVFHFD